MPTQTQRVSNLTVPTLATEEPLRSKSQLKVGSLLTGSGFKDVWLITGIIDDHIEMRRMPLESQLPDACAAGRHDLDGTGFSFGRPCRRGCGYIITKVAVDQPMGLVVTDGPPAAYIVNTPANYTLQQPVPGVVYCNSLGTICTVVRNGGWVATGAMPLIPALYPIWKTPEGWL